MPRIIAAIIAVAIVFGLGTALFQGTENAATPHAATASDAAPAPAATPDTPAPSPAG